MPEARDTTNLSGKRHIPVHNLLKWKRKNSNNIVEDELDLIYPKWNGFCSDENFLKYQIPLCILFCEEVAMLTCLS